MLAVRGQLYYEEAVLRRLPVNHHREALILWMGDEYKPTRRGHDIQSRQADWKAVCDIRRYPASIFASRPPSPSYCCRLCPSLCTLFTSVLWGRKYANDNQRTVRIPQMSKICSLYSEAMEQKRCESACHARLTRQDSE